MIERCKPFRKEGLGYVYEPADGEGRALGVSLRVDAIHGIGERMVGEMLIETTLPGVNPHLLMTTQNLTGATARNTLAKQLGEKTPGMHIPWGEILEAFCVAVLRAERTGPPFLKIGDREDETALPDVIDHLVNQGRVNDIHGPMGDGKGYLAAFIVVCHTAGLDFAQLCCHSIGSVLYLDWEDDDTTLNRRLRAITRGYGISPVTINYRMCHGALRDQVLQIARFIASEHITMIVVDSVELACGIGSDHGTYEERAQGLYDGLRSITTSVGWPVSVLLIDHVSEAVRTNKKEVGKAYGSGMKMAWARNAWEVRKDQEASSPLANIGLYRFKGNHSGNMPPIGIQLDFSKWPQQVTAKQAEIRDSESLSGRQPATAQIFDALQSSPMDTKDLAMVTGLSREAVRVAVNRLKQRGRVAQGTDGRWGRRSLVDPFQGEVSDLEEPPDEDGSFPF